MSDEKAIQVSQTQVSQQTREMIEHGAQAMLQQAVQYLQDAIHASQLRKENERLLVEVSRLAQCVDSLTIERDFEKEKRIEAESTLHNTEASRDIIAKHRDQLLNESSAIHEKFRRLRHSMDTMRGIMESNLAA